MGCSRCEASRRRSLEKRREILRAKIDRWQSQCDAGDKSACLALADFLRSEQFRKQNQYVSELHRRAG